MVKWVGYDESKSTWEPEQNLVRAEDEVRNYWRNTFPNVSFPGVLSPSVRAVRPWRAVSHVEDISYGTWVKSAMEDFFVPYQDSDMIDSEEEDMEDEEE